jgi:hypothetical protein
MIERIKREKMRKNSGGVGGQAKYRGCYGTYNEQACPPRGGQGRECGGQARKKIYVAHLAQHMENGLKITWRTWHSSRSEGSQVIGESRKDERL